MSTDVQFTWLDSAVIGDLLLRFGYGAVAAGAFLEGEFVLLAAGALVQVGYLRLVPVVLAGALGSVAWSQVWFHVGHVAGAGLLTQRPAWQNRARRVERWLSASGLWLLLGGRFVAGMGTVLPAMIGASGFPRRRFTCVDSVGALIWSTGFSCAGVGVGIAVRRMALRNGAGLALMGAGAALGFVWLWLAARRRNRKLVKARSQNSHEVSREHASAAQKQVIITGDDFGLALAVNEAVEQAHREGVLTTTSLLVAGHAAADAVARARRNPALRVGLHLALCEGWPSSPAREVSLLTNASGELRHPLFALLWFTLLSPSVTFRRQLEAEIRAQFLGFRALGLELDHVNGHNNMQLHPVVLPILIRVAREHGVSAIRLPYEPLVPAWRAARRRLFSRLCVWLVMAPWAMYVKRRLQREGFRVNDYLFGIFDCGAMTSQLLSGIIANLPCGLSEIHCHPATRRCPETDRATPGYQHQAELEALTDPFVRRALSHHAQLISGFAGLQVGSGGGRSST